MRHKRLGRRTAGDRMHHRRLDLKEAGLDHLRTNGRDHPAARHKGATRVLGHDQVDVTLAVLDLLIGEAVKFVRQGAQALGQQANAAGLDGELAGASLHQRALGANDVTQVPMFEGFERLGTDSIQLHVDLDAPAGVLQGGERGLAHDALQHHAAGNAHRFRGGFELLSAGQTVHGMQRRRLMLRAEVVGEGRASLSEARELGAPLGNNVRFVELVFGSVVSGGGRSGFSHVEPSRAVGGGRDCTAGKR